MWACRQTQWKTSRTDTHTRVHTRIFPSNKRCNRWKLREGEAQIWSLYTLKTHWFSFFSECKLDLIYLCWFFGPSICIEQRFRFINIKFAKAKIHSYISTKQISLSRSPLSPYLSLAHSPQLAQKVFWAISPCVYMLLSLLLLPLHIYIRLYILLTKATYFHRFSQRNWFV